MYAIKPLKEQSFEIEALEEYRLADILLPSNIQLAANAPINTVNALSALINEIVSDKPNPTRCRAIKEQLFPHQKTPIDASTYLVASMYSYALNNPEAACFYAANATTDKATYSSAMTFFYQFHTSLDAPESADEYLEFALEGLDSCKATHLKNAKNNFEESDYSTADHHIQRIAALTLPFIAKTPEISIYKRSLEIKTKLMSHSDALKNWREILHWKFSGSTESEKSEQWNAVWENNPNKKLLGKLTAELMSSFSKDNTTYLELGCHMGGLINMVSDECKRLDVRAKFIGIEQDTIICNKAKEVFPEIDFIIGSHKILDSSKPIASTTIDIFMLSQICFLMPPEAIDIVLRFAQKNCRYIILLDDFSNTYGNQSVPRRCYLVHPFHTLFKKYGFEIERCEIIPQPNIGNNGLLVARNSTL